MSTTDEYGEHFPRRRGESVLPIDQVPITQRYQPVAVALSVKRHTNRRRRQGEPARTSKTISVAPRY